MVYPLHDGFNVWVMHAPFETTQVGRRAQLCVDEMLEGWQMALALLCSSFKFCCI